MRRRAAIPSRSPGSPRVRAFRSRGLASTFALASSCLLLAAGARAEEASATAAPERSSERLARFREDPAALAPIGLVDASTLPKWGFAASYRYSILHHDDLRKNDDRVSIDSTLLSFQEAPRRRDIEVHRFGLQFAPHDRVTLALGVPILVQRTHVITQTRDKYATDTQGIGDLELRALVPFMRNGAQTLQVEMGLTAPTGSTGEHGRNGADASQRLPFPQQLGSGTVDLLPGIVYRGSHETVSWGLLGRGVFRVYKNSKGYREGDHYSLATWVANSWTDWMSTSLRLSWERTQNVHGASRTSQNPELDPKRQALEVIEIGPGVNFKLPFARAPRLGVEMAWPVWQSLNGPQLERDWRLTAGWKWDF